MTMTSNNEMRELADKELDAVCGGGWGFRTGDIYAFQKNVAVVNKSWDTTIYQSNNNNTGVQYA
ncbi:hypothetical protein JIR23_26080 [Bradyrhizobium diazoefficiens]|nr:hypothetical protein [Bradyrhizobium diazoefficiens]QQN62979.1 hypothetical protein JIR23_26080 [Bradyrhizobium diazoefficiens]